MEIYEGINEVMAFSANGYIVKFLANQLLKVFSFPLRLKE